MGGDGWGRGLEGQRHLLRCPTFASLGLCAFIMFREEKNVTCIAMLHGRLLSSGGAGRHALLHTPHALFCRSIAAARNHEKNKQKQKKTHSFVRGLSKPFLA